MLERGQLVKYVGKTLEGCLERGELVKVVVKMNNKKVLIKRTSQNGPAHIFVTEDELELLEDQ